MCKGSHTTTSFNLPHRVGHKISTSFLKGDIHKRCSELVIQICYVEEADILKGVMSKDHVHIHVEYPPPISINELVKRMKG